MCCNSWGRKELGTQEMGAAALPHSDGLGNKGKGMSTREDAWLRLGSSRAQIRNQLCPHPMLPSDLS